MELFACYSNRIGYFVLYSNGNISLSADNSIRELLKMNWQQYNSLIDEYNTDKKGCFFGKEEDCQKLCNYLNEIYGPIIKLTEVF